MKKLYTFLLTFVFAFFLFLPSAWSYRGPGRGAGGHGREGRPGDHRGHYEPHHSPGRGVRFALGNPPRGGWRGTPFYYGGYHYYVWAWGPWAPWWRFREYDGWRLGLFYYVPDGLRCYSDNPRVVGRWSNYPDNYYSSEDAINGALAACENDPNVRNLDASQDCRIRTCEKW